MRVWLRKTFESKKSQENLVRLGKGDKIQVMNEVQSVTPKENKERDKRISKREEFRTHPNREGTLHILEIHGNGKDDEDDHLRFQLEKLPDVYIFASDLIDVRRVLP